LAEDLDRFLAASEAILGSTDEGGFRTAASQGDWTTVLGTAASALRSRLTGEA